MNNEHVLMNNGNGNSERLAKIRVNHGFLSLFIFLFIVLSCRNPMEWLQQEQIPSGMGSLSLILDGHNSRTILPQIPVFLVYELAFTGTADVTISRSIDTLSDPIHLLSGTYHLLVTAYMDETKTEPAAWGAEDTLRIDEGKGVTHAITLRPFTPDGVQNGTFNWNISFPDEVTIAFMSIRSLSFDDTVEEEYYFEGAGGETPLSGSVSLASGYYNVLFTLEKPGTQTLQWLEILHVYQSLVSSYTQDFYIELFNNVMYTVTFIFNDGSTGNVIQSYSHGDVVAPISPQPQSAKEGYTFGGWYTNEQFSQRWDFSSPLARSQTLYLRWLSETCSDSPIVGTFRGDITLHGFMSTGQTILQLFEDNTARMQLTNFPDYTILANSSYHAIRREVQLSNLTLHTSDMGRQAMEKLMADMPSNMTLPVRQWDMDEVIVIDTDFMSGNLYRVDDFDFSPEITFTEFTLHIEYPDASKHGNYVLTEVKFLDISKPPITLIGTLQGSRLTKKANIINDFTQNSAVRILVTSYLFDSMDDINTMVGFVASQPALLMAGARIAQTTNNPWQPPVIFTLLSGVDNQEFTVRFPGSLNIRINHGNFTNNNPVVSWDPYPGANGYFILISVRDTLSNITANNHVLVPAFHQHTMQTSATVFSHRINFTSVDTFHATIPPAIRPGDIIRVEVYALDHSGFLDSEHKTGALFMDSLTIVR